MSTQQIIYSTAVSAGIPDPLARLMVAQAIHETGNFTSRFFKEYNNAFGYSYAGSKYQLPGGGSNADNGVPIGRYASVIDSTMEVVDWIKRRAAQGKFPSNLATITDPAIYAKLLKDAGYYGDTMTNYLKGLKAGLSKVTDLATTTAGMSIAGILVVGGIVYYLSKQ